MRSKTAAAMDDWLTALDQSQAAPDGFTAAELATRLNLGIKSARERISRGIAAGLIELAGHRSIRRIDGQAARAPVYRAMRKPDRRN